MSTPIQKFPFRVMHGQENRQGEFAIVRWFQCKPGEQDANLAIAINRFTNLDNDISRSSSIEHPAVRGIPKSIGGSWSEVVALIPEGAITKLYIQKKMFGWLGHARTIQIYLLHRTDAAYQKLSVPLLGRVTSQRNHLDVDGRFDVLSFKDVRIRGIFVNSVFGQAAIESKDYTLTVIEREKKALTSFHSVKTTDAKGDEIEVHIEQRKRSLEID